jgi:ribosome maturation factor RimP
MDVRKLTAKVLTFGLLHFSIVAGGTRLQAASPSNEVKQRVEQFGVGTELKLKLAGGDSVRGQVQSIGPDSFLFVPKEDSTPREIAFSELEKVRYPKGGYKADTAPDPAAAKRMVVQLGVGEHIMVKVSPTEKVRGHIRAINEDHFLVQPDGQTANLSVPYNSVWKVNKNLSFGATIAIVVGIAAAVVLILVLSGEDDIDVLPN